MTARAILRITEVSIDGQSFALSRFQDSESVRESVAELHNSPRPADDDLIRWYLEDYPAFPRYPAPLVAERAEKQLAAIGEDLFGQLFGGESGMDLWQHIQRRPAGLGDVRIEIDPDPGNVPGHRWELLRDPASPGHLALEAAEFVRVSRQAGETPSVGTDDSELRVLVVICRPAGDRDVPFRSIASRLIRSTQMVAGLSLEVLRPPTFAQLMMKLRLAATLGRPFHVVHFDGHGDYVETAPGSSRTKRGCLVFESADGTGAHLVDGTTMGSLLAACNVPVLILNACRSAYAEPLSAPDDSNSDTESEPSAVYGELASEVAACGVPGVVAMRYNVYVSTAAEFVGNLYLRLAAREPLGRAVTAARAALAADTRREIGTATVSLQDWTVPVVYEARPLTLTQAPAGSTPALPSKSDSLPDRPQAGMVGRDETLLLLDRLFSSSRLDGDPQSNQVVMLYGLAGAGKSTAAAEFARWYHETGGLRRQTGGSGPVMWTSFQYRITLGEALAWIGEVFGPTLATYRIEWEAVPPPYRAQVALQFLSTVPMLWVWDNVETVAGFPTPSDSPLSADEQRELRDFLNAVSERTRWRVLLTSRRDEQAWLGPMPNRLQMPTMPLQDRLELLKATAGQDGAGIADLDWRPLLRYSQGNALTLTVLARVVTAEGVDNPERLADLLHRLQSGERGLEGSLAASLDYSVERAFTNDERRVLGLLHLFCGTVHVSQLLAMGDEQTCGADTLLPVANWSEVHLTRLLEKAVELGLFTARRTGFYDIHPALPWYLESMFRQFWAAESSRCERAFAKVLSNWSGMLAALTGLGHLHFTGGILFNEERNLHRALTIARSENLYDVEIGCVAGLHVLLFANGRLAEWATVLEPVVMRFLVEIDEPAPGKEDHFVTVLGYMAELAERRREWHEAAYARAVAASHVYVQASPVLERFSRRTSSKAASLATRLAYAVTRLADLQRARPVPACMRLYRMALELVETYGVEDRRLAAIIRSGIGMTFTEVGWFRDLEQAQWWLTSALETFPEHDVHSRAQCAGNLARASYRLYLEARQLGEPATEQRQKLLTTMHSWERLVANVPAENHNLISHANTELGNIYRDLRDTAAAMSAYRVALQHAEADTNWYNYAFVQYSITRLYARERRYADALNYAQAAHQALRAAVPADQGLLRQVEEYLTFLPEFLKRERGEETWVRPGFQWRDQLTGTLLADADLEDEAYPELGDFDLDNLPERDTSEPASDEEAMAFITQVSRAATAAVIREQRSGRQPEWLTAMRARNRVVGLVTDLAGVYDEDRATLVSAGRDGFLRLWSMGDGESLSRRQTGTATGMLRPIAGAYDQHTVVVSEAIPEGSVRLWRINRWSSAEGEEEPPTVLAGHTGRVNALVHDVRLEKQVVVSAGDDGTIRTWDLNGTPMGQPLVGHAGPVSAIALFRDGTEARIISGGADSTVRLWDPDRGAVDTRFGHRGPVVAVAALTKDDRTCIASVGADSTIRFWDPADHRDLRRVWLPAHWEPPHRRNRRRGTVSALVGNTTGPVTLWWERVWNGPSHERERHRHGVGRLLTASNDNLIAVGSGTTVLTFDASGNVKHRLLSRAPLRAMAFCGTMLVLATTHGMVAVYAGASDADAARMMFLNEL